MALSQIMWPLSLPQYPLVQGYQDTPGRAVIVSDFDVGPKRQRKRSSAAMRKVTATYYMRNSVKSDWESFYELSLGRSFWWPDPMQGGAYVYARIANDVKLTPQGPSWFSLQLELEVWPYITQDDMEVS